MLAVVKCQGHQYIVKPSDKIIVNKINQEEGSQIILKEVLLFEDEKENKTLIGSPYLNNIEIEAKILKHTKGDKVRVFKFKPKKRYSINKGHRDHLTELQIVKISQTNS